MINRFALLFSILLALIACKTQEEINLSLVKAPSGTYRGVEEQDEGVISFKGIPFAKPPIGELRWKAPQALDHIDTVFIADTFGASPMQNNPSPFGPWSSEYLIPSEPIDEDCLTLNIWRPSNTESESLPVFVWIYGGGFNSGGSAVPLYDGTSLAQKGIIVVSINYRVGIMGFLAHPELTKEAGQSGNYGFLDQIAGLKWVHENIAAFGGDLDKITIAGQSAGSMSVNTMVATPLARGLFQQAIPQSGGNFTRGLQTLEEAEQKGLAIMEELGLQSIKDMRALPVEQLQSFTNQTGGPNIDGHVLPASIAEIFDENKENPVSLLTGWAQDEGLMFGPLLSADQYKESIQNNYGELANEILNNYPGTNDSLAYRSQLDLSRDLIFGAQNFEWAEIQQSKNRPVYVYRFAHTTPAEGDYARYKAFHSGELPFMFDNISYFTSRNCGEAEESLAEQMSQYWVNFVRTGDPNGENLPEWPAYESSNRQVMWFDHGSVAKELPDASALITLNTALKSR